MSRVILTLTNYRAVFRFILLCMKKIFASIILIPILWSKPSLADISDTYTCVMTRADGPAIKTLQNFIFKRYETKLVFGNMPSGTYEPSYFRKGYEMEITD